MHERHAIHRAETTPKWNLHPNAPTRVPMGPALAVTDPARSPGPTNDEIRAEISRQRAISRQMTKQIDRPEQHLENLRGSLDVSKTVAVQNLALRQKLIETEERVEKIEQELEQSASPEPAPTTAEAIAEEAEKWQAKI
jgi:hypothetical protein